MTLLGSNRKQKDHHLQARIWLRQEVQREVGKKNLQHTETLN